MKDMQEMNGGGADNARPTRRKNLLSLKDAVCVAFSAGTQIMHILTESIRCVHIDRIRVFVVGRVLQVRLLL